MRNTGEHSAVEQIPERRFSQSGPGLKRPTPVATAGRTPAARPSPLQSKTGQGAGQRPAIKTQRAALATSHATSVAREAGALDHVTAIQLDESSIRELISFFQILDRWDREATEARGTQ